MKLIKHDQRTAGFLSTWAGSKKLYMSGFYFWCSGGNEIQMTQEGLLRTLLLEALRTFPHLAPLIFPKRLETFVAFGDQVVWYEPLTLTELLTAFKLFVHEATKSHKIFLLIDGLDEFNGSYSQQIHLIEFIQSLLTSDVKLCVSSRPWNVFEDAFNTRPCLRLEELTYGDIRHYCSSNLSNNLGFAALQGGDPKAASDLIENVSTKACGVFLWVILVVNSLREGLTDGERLSDLQKRLDSLPSDLETLFWRILNSVDFERISQLLQIVRTSPISISILHLSYADEDDPEFVFNLPTKPLPYAMISSRVELMRRRLNACGKGLLEPQGGNSRNDPHATVGYLHRTVKDFIHKTDIWDILVSAMSPTFDPGMRLSVSHVSHLNILPTNSVDYVVEEYASLMRKPRMFWHEVISCIWMILNYAPRDAQLRLLEEVGDVVDEIVSRSAPNHARVSYDHCPSELCRMSKLESFLHLAVKLQIWIYVNVHVSDVQGEDRVQKLSLFLRTAVTDFAWEYGDFKSTEPNLFIVTRLLELGATLDGLTWHHVLGNTTHKTGLLILLLSYGADPFDIRLMVGEGAFATEVIELAKAKREEATRNGRGPNITEPISVIESEPIEGKRQSKWSRLRSRYSSRKADVAGSDHS
jgi:hypothetical protein